MALAAGTRLGPYEILASIGAGGMGEVYRARDTKLDRAVAIKILPESFAHDAERMARFEREAHVLASLNHPNIATIHGLEESNGIRALVMELVEGPTLAERIGHTAMPLEEVLPIAKQIAEGVEYAHERGIIHRDLKPANVKLTADGNVKILDFGLAKALETPTPQGNPSISPTLTLEGTRAGVILGTAAYMAPEQARGVIVDKRADIWAFGVVLYEMLTGKQPFVGATVSDTLAAVLRAEPKWDAIPFGIRRLVQRCLDKDPKRRLQAIGDARLEIEDFLAAPEAPAPTARRTVLPWVVSTALLVALAVLMLVHLRERPTESPVVRYSISAPEKAGFIHLVPSPDGRQIAFTGGKLFVRRLDSLTSQPLTGTDSALLPFWSPDSRFVGYFADGKLKRIDLGAPSKPGPQQTICIAPGTGGATWNRDGVIVFGAGPGTSLYRVSAAGGDAKALTSLDQSRKERSHFWPWFLPDGRHFFYTVVSAQRENSGIYIGSLDSADRRRLLPDLSNAAYVTAPGEGGRLLFLREGTLMVQRFDAVKLQLAGEPIPVVEQVQYDGAWVYGFYGASENGVLVYLGGELGASQAQLTWFDRTGKRLAKVGEPASVSGSVLYAPQISRDEEHVAVGRPDPKNKTTDLWLIELARGSSSRFTFDPAEDVSPVWSPDGTRIIFSSSRAGALDLYKKDANGGGKEEPLLKSGQDKFADDWSPDGRFLLYTELDTRTGTDLWVLPLFGDRKQVPFLKTEFDEDSGALSSDGKWVAYVSNESGQSEIYVRAFPGTETGAPDGSGYSAGAKVQISIGGGGGPHWRRDGRELYYRTYDGKIMAVDIRTDSTFQSGIPRILFEDRFHPAFTGFAVTANGQRFLIPAPVGETDRSAAAVVLNWTKGLKQ